MPMLSDDQGRQLATARMHEDEIVSGLLGDILAMLAATRLYSRYLVRDGSSISYRLLPARLRKRIDRDTFDMLSCRVDRILGIGGVLSPIQDIEYADDDTLERARRVELYSRQWDQMVAKYGAATLEHKSATVVSLR